MNANNQQQSSSTTNSSTPTVTAPTTQQSQLNANLLARENTKSLNDRLKAFFKGFSRSASIGTSGPTSSTAGVIGGYPTTSSASIVKPLRSECIVLTPELIQDLSPQQLQQPPPGQGPPQLPHTRLRALQLLTETCRSRRIEPHTVEKLWTLTQDLFSHPDSQVRHLAFSTYTIIIQSQFEKSSFLRAKLFSFVKTHEVAEDTAERFQFLKALSENGRDVSYFEEKIGPFIWSWMMSENCSVMGKGAAGGNGSGEGSPGSVVSVEEFMQLVTNVVKFNCSFLDDDVLGGIIQNTCITCLTTVQIGDNLACINLLNTVVMYSMIPPNTLQTVVATLCRTVNVDTLCAQSWKVMRNLLGTHLGHSGLFTLITFMGNSEELGVSVPENDLNSVIRGAVFFTGVVLWGGGNRVVRSLLRGGSGGGGVISVVLSAYLKILPRNNALITYEVLLRVQDLIRHSADSLQVIGWDLVLDIMAKIVTYSRNIDDEVDEDEEETVKHQWIRNSRLLVQQIHDTLDLIENILDTKTFCGDSTKYWQIVDGVCHSRPTTSVEKLLAHKHSLLLNASVSPIPSARFLPELIHLTQLHFHTECRTHLRLKALLVIQKLCIQNQDILEEELLDTVILPHLKSIEHEPDVAIRQHCVKFIVDFLMESRSKKGHDLLHYIEKVLNRPFDLQQNSPEITHIFTENEVADVLVAVNGIVKIFQRKVYSLPSSIAVTAYKILVKHLEKHYKRVSVLDGCPSIRYQVFECFFRIRANSLYHLGFLNDNDIIEHYSCYLAVDHKDEDRTEHSSSTHESFHFGQGPLGGGGSSHGVSPPIQQEKPGQGPFVSYISLTAACKQVICCLKKEKEWKILELVLLQLPHVMENKALILSKHGNDVDVLASQLCSMVTDKLLFSTVGGDSALRNTPPKFSRSDFQSYVFPALTSLISYHSHLEPKIQQQIVKCLEHGLVSKSSRICISALTTCTLEMKEVMHKLIPEILLSLSKISPKLNIAIPVLEFLSTLIHLPRVFASFVQDQYMSIFAICLPYTNPFKFNHYVVSLAHHVIALWFLKCRLSFRKGFVSYIIKGLESNVWAPFVEAEERKLALPINEDSSNRKRSSSLTDQTRSRRERMVSGQAAAPQKIELHRQGSQQQPIDKCTMQFHQELTETCVDLMARYAFADCSPLPHRFESSGFLTNGGHSQSWMIDNRIITITTSGCSQRELRDGLCDRCWTVCRQHSGKETPRQSVLVGQHSYDDDDVREERDRERVGVKRSYTISGSKTDAGLSVMRRRHRSALVSRERPAKVGGGEGVGGGGMAEDDLHLENKLSRESGEKGMMWKTEAQLCGCWCQGWAEILIRRPTGNTSWMMRVQNLIGGGVVQTLDTGVLKDLSTIYMNEIVDGAEKEVRGEEGGEQKQESCAEAGIGKEEDTQQRGLEQTSPGTGRGESTTPSPKKTPVRRSNSSPEMAKQPPEGIQRQEGIGEEDESELSGGSTELQGQAYLPSCEAIPEEQIATKVKSPPEEKEQIKETSPQQTSPVSSTQSLSTTAENPLLQPMKRDRLSTISVMTPARRNSSQPVRRMTSLGTGDMRMGSGMLNDPGIRSGISPSFIFLQLCGQGILGGGTTKPLLLPGNESTGNSLKVLDYIPPYETHKIGVLYVGPGQAKNEAAILQNAYGSSRYKDFLQGLGNLIKLSETDPVKTFLGGLDGRGGEDGEFGCIWQDDVMQVIFHVATLMPTKLATDPNGNGKKRHIGNDFVAIIYNNSEEEFDISTIKCQFLYAYVIIQPLDHRTNRVFVKAKPSLEEDIGHTDVKIVSDLNLPIMARQLALHSNLASMIQKKLSQKAEPYASNWLERLRAIKRLRARLFPETVGAQAGVVGGAAATAGLSLSTQELSEGVGGGVPVPNTLGVGSAAAPTSAGTQNKRPSFIVDDFTEYV